MPKSIPKGKHGKAKQSFGTSSANSSYGKHRRHQSGGHASSSSMGMSIGPAPSGAQGGWGQHFLKNPSVVQKIVDKSNIQPTDIVLEIGPGNGTMTTKLLEKSKKVVAIEVDQRMVTELKMRVQGSPAEHSLELIKGDALKIQWPYAHIMCANIPYNISSPLIFKMLAHRPSLRRAVLLLQEEFALRLTARPGDPLWSRLSANTQLLANVKQVMKVGKNNFKPPPKVDSRVVKIEPKSPPPDIDFVEWDGLVRLLFNRKNRTLRSVLTTKSVLRMLEENFVTWCSLNDIDPSSIADVVSSSSAASSSKSGTDDSKDESHDVEMEMEAEAEETSEQTKEPAEESMDEDGFVAVFQSLNSSSSSSSSSSAQKRQLSNLRKPSPKSFKSKFDVKKIMIEVLEELKLDKERTAKLDIEDFMAVLAGMNARGIHFS